jgi:hypothetical protein
MTITDRPEPPRPKGQTPKNHYYILGLEMGLTPEEAGRRAAKNTWHPVLV